MRRPFWTRSGRFFGWFPNASTLGRAPHAWFHTQSYFTSTRLKAATMSKGPQPSGASSTSVSRFSTWSQLYMSTPLPRLKSSIPKDIRVS
jgi:hypothetical protein